MKNRRFKSAKFYLHGSNNADHILNEIKAERKRQNLKWGEQNYPMTDGDFNLDRFRIMRRNIREENRVKEGKNCWYNILAKEFIEAFAETKPEKQREEMIQVAAVAVAIVECLERKLTVNKEARE